MAPIRINSENDLVAYLPRSSRRRSGADAQQPLEILHTEHRRTLALPRAQTENSTASAHYGSWPGVAFRLDPIVCRNALALTYSQSTLTLGFTIESKVPATWKALAVTPLGIANLWSQEIPAVAPAASVNVLDSRGAADRDPRHIDLAQHARPGRGLFRLEDRQHEPRVGAPAVRQ